MALKPLDPSRPQKPDPNVRMKPLPEQLILICEKCGIKLAPPPAENPSRALQQKLKALCKTEISDPLVRPVISGCLGVCPEGEVTIAIAGQKRSLQYFTLTNPGDPSVTSEILAQITRK